MCFVSVVMDYGRKVPPYQWTPETFDAFKATKAQLEALDEQLDQPDCEDPAKSQWMKDVEERLRRLEGGSDGST